MFDRYRAVESIAYTFRRELNYKTRVKISGADIELCTREPGSPVWRRQELPDNLPNFNFGSSIRPTTPSSPPPGRPGRHQLPCSGAENERVVSEAARSQEN